MQRGLSPAARAGAVGAFALCVGSLAMCQSPTQITLTVYTDVACADQPNDIVVLGALADLDSKPGSASSSSCDDATHRIATLVIVPSGAKDEPIAVEVVQAMKGKAADQCVRGGGSGCIVAKRALRYLPHATIELPVWMRTSCIDVKCDDPSTTCVKGTCVSATIDDPSKCIGDGCGEGSLMPEPSDGGVRDATVDGDATPSDAPPSDGSPSDSPQPDGGRLDASVCTACLSPISAGIYSSCTLDGGTVVCWGGNSQDELGRGGSGLPKPPGLVLVPGDVPLTGTVGLSTTRSASCALRDGGGASCWGQSTAFGTLTDASIGMSGIVPYASPAAQLGSAVEVSVGAVHVCWRNDAHSIFCVGENPTGQLGVADGDAGGAAVPVSFGADVKQMSAGVWSTCVLTVDQRVRCFGENSYGQSNPASGTSPALPAVVDLTALGSAPVAVTVGNYQVCAILADTTVACWGDGTNAATGQTLMRSPPGRVLGPGSVSLSGITQLALGDAHSCALGGGTVYCWGANSQGQLGHVAAGVQPIAAAVSNISGATSIAAGATHTCATLVSGQVWCWGRDAEQQLGPAGDGGPSSMPLRAL